jgi:predicted RNase H-like HicB family nuclease
VWRRLAASRSPRIWCHEEAIANIREAIRLYIATLEEDELPVPEERFETLVL